MPNDHARIQELQKEIAVHDRRYYADGTSKPSGSRPLQGTLFG